MIILDVFDLLIKIAGHIINQPDEHIEYLDKDLKDLFTNKEKAMQAIDVLYPDQNSLDIPNSQAQKKLKEFLVWCFLIYEFGKYLDEKASVQRELKRQFLIALAIFDAMLSHQAWVAEFWDVLSDEYIQHLQDMLLIAQTIQTLIPFYMKKAVLDSKIDNLQQEVNRLEGEMIRINNTLNSRMDDLIKLSQERLGAVLNVTDTAIVHYQHVLDQGTQNLSELVITKNDQLEQVRQQLKNYDINYPNDSLGKRSLYQESIDKTERELDQVKGTLNRYEEYANKLKNEYATIQNNVNQLIQKSHSLTGIEERKAISEQLEIQTDLLAQFAKDKAPEVKSFIGSVENDLKNLSGLNKEFSRSLSEQIKPAEPSVDNALKLHEDRIAYKKETISNLITQRSNIEIQRAEKMQELESAKNERDELLDQMNQSMEKIKQRYPNFDLSTISTAAIEAASKRSKNHLEISPVSRSKSLTNTQHFKP